MSEHLPECPVEQGTVYSTKDASVVWSNGECICDRLRACEQRVLAAYIDTATDRVFDNGYAEALGRARDGVEAERDSYVSDCRNDNATPDMRVLGAYRHALAAIDALRVPASLAPSQEPAYKAEHVDWCRDIACHGCEEIKDEYDGQWYRDLYGGDDEAA